MPTLTIDGRPVEVEEGCTILKAAARLAIEIPTFCFHEGLSVAGNCRMCLVEVIGSGKPVASCEVAVREGMEVLTGSPMVLEARRSTLEFILLNHPVDCPICDCAGECVLQNHYMAHSARRSRIDVRKVHEGKAVVIGPNVMLHRDRCIHCSRCVRFCSEVSNSGRLVESTRSDCTEIAVVEGKQFDDPYSLCTVDLCPVGALTSRDFHSGPRAWQLETGEAICPECARGCNLFVDHAEGRIYRLRPRSNAKVNGWWACDRGRLAYHDHQEGRSLEARIGGFDQPERLGTARAAAVAAAAGFAQLLATGRRVALVVAATASLEEAYAALEFAATSLCETTVYLGARSDGESDSLLMVADRNSNGPGIKRLAARKGLRVEAVDRLFDGDGLTAVGGVLSLGSDYPFPEPPDGAALRSAVVLSARSDGVAAKATIHVPIPGHFEREGHFVNCDGLVQRSGVVLPPATGIAAPHVVLKEIGGKLGKQQTFVGFAELQKAALQAYFEAGAGPSTTGVR